MSDFQMHPGILLAALYVVVAILFVAAAIQDRQDIKKERENEAKG